MFKLMITQRNLGKGSSGTRGNVQEGGEAEATTRGVLIIADSRLVWQCVSFGDRQTDSTRRDWGGKRTKGEERKGKGGWDRGGGGGARGGARERIRS